MASVSVLYCFAVVGFSQEIVYSFGTSFVPQLRMTVDIHIGFLTVCSVAQTHTHTQDKTTITSKPSSVSFLYCVQNACSSFLGISTVTIVTLQLAFLLLILKYLSKEKMF